MLQMEVQRKPLRSQTWNTGLDLKLTMGHRCQQTKHKSEAVVEWWRAADNVIFRELHPTTHKERIVQNISMT